MALLALAKVSKSFGPVRALAGIDLNVEPGEVVGVMGDNGAGKSTLIRLIAGNFPPDAGTFVLDGRHVRFGNAAEARSAGIEAVYQDLALCNNLTAAANVFLGRELQLRVGPVRILDHEAMLARTAELLRELGSKASPVGRVGQMSGGERQAVAIARAMYFDSELIILDEPTNNLGVAETRGVLRFVRNARNSGHSCIFIAHNIHHVFQVADRIVVMRRGRIVADDIDPKRTSVEEVEFIITGMSPEDLRETASATGA